MVFCKLCYNGVQSEVCCSNQSRNYFLSQEMQYNISHDEVFVSFCKRKHLKTTKTKVHSVSLQFITLSMVYCHSYKPNYFYFITICKAATIIK